MGTADVDQNEVGKRRIDLSVLDEAPRLINTQADVQANRKVVSAVFAWVYPTDDSTPNAAVFLTLGVQAGIISTLLDNIERLLSERALEALARISQELDL